MPAARPTAPTSVGRVLRDQAGCRVRASIPLADVRCHPAHGEHGWTSRRDSLALGEVARPDLRERPKGRSFGGETGSSCIRACDTEWSDRCARPADIRPHTWCAPIDARPVVDLRPLCERAYGTAPTSGETGAVLVVWVFVYWNEKGGRRRFLSRPALCKVNQVMVLVPPRQIDRTRFFCRTVGEFVRAGDVQRAATVADLAHVRAGQGVRDALGPARHGCTGADRVPRAHRRVPARASPDGGIHRPTSIRGGASFSVCSILDRSGASSSLSMRRGAGDVEASDHRSSEGRRRWAAPDTATGRVLANLPMPGLVRSP